MRGSFAAAGLLTVTVFCAGGAQADPVIVGSYYEDNGTNTCNSPLCDVSFSAIGRRTSVLLTHVSCHVETQTQVLTRSFLGVIAAGAIDSTREEDLARSPVSETAGSLHYYQVGGQVVFLYTSRQTPFVRIFQPAFGGMFVSCRITGQQPAPN